jgi:hypothetical protein
MKSTVSRCLVALSLLALGSGVSAAIMYRWVDAQGVVHYSDTPHPGAEQIQLSGAQTYHGTPAPAGGPSAATPPVEPTVAPYQSCAITQPNPDTALYAPEAVDVSVRVIPSLRAGDQVSVSADGAPLPPTSPDGFNYQVLQPERGTHNLSAQVRDASGTVVCSSAVSFSIQRPSVNTPGSPVRPH